MFFQLVAAVLLSSLSASAALVPVTPNELPSLAANGTKVIIASGLYGSELNVAHGNTADGNPVIVYLNSTATAINQQWILTNTSTANTYTIQSASDPQPFLTYPLAILQPNTTPTSIDSNAVISSSCSPIEYTIEQIKTGANGYYITETLSGTTGGRLTAYPQLMQNGATGAVSFQSDAADMAAAQNWTIFLAPA